MHKPSEHAAAPPAVSNVFNIGPGTEAAQRLASIVQSSDDAIVAKDLNGIVTDWNRGAERLFGYTAQEMIGMPIITIIPADRHGEEAEILRRLRLGERIDHYETVRQRKDGSLLDISLTVSPILDAAGRVVGASKIARDITDRKRAEEQKMLLLREMNHRVKNLFALSSSLLNLSARSAGSVEELVSTLQERFGALARAHSLTMRLAGEQSGPLETTLHALLRTSVQPFDCYPDQERSRVTITGSDIALRESDVTNFALVLHEIAANAAKHGALAQPEGRVDIVCTKTDERFIVNWKESAFPVKNVTPGKDGFGTFLTRTTIDGSLGGMFERNFSPEGLMITISVPLARLKGNESAHHA